MEARTGALIRDILINECPDVTVLLIAHKLASIAQCDMIVEMGDGRVLDARSQMNFAPGHPIAV